VEAAVAVIKPKSRCLPPDGSTGADTQERRFQTAYRQLAERLLPLRFKPPITRRPRFAAPETPALQALTAAALALPGLLLSPAKAADGDEATFQYGLYQEGQRFQLESYDTLNLEPIRVDNFSAGGSTTFLDRVKFAFNYTQDTWSGATPLTTAPAASMFLLESGASMAIQSNVLVDKQLRTFYSIGANGIPVADKQTVHMMTMASPETRKQGDFRLGYEWDEAALNVNGGVSVEDDYNSHFIGADGRMDFNGKLTTLNLGLTYTDSLISAQRDSQYSGYIDYTTVFDIGDLKKVTEDGKPVDLTGEREDWSGRVGLTQVLSKNSVLKGGVNYTYSSGFLENPYKVAELIFVDPNQSPDPNDLLTADTQGVLERRPDKRHQWTFDLGSVHYFSGLDASLHLDYRFFHDDWGINAHTFEAAWGQPVGSGWTITPRVRYYSQDAANFYSPYFIFDQARSFTKDFTTDYSTLPIANFSSDQRLSGYGALSGGVTINKQFAKGVNFNAGFEYYTHQGGLKLGGGGEDEYANFSYYLINVALRVNFSALANLADGGDHGGHAGHAGHSIVSGHAPAGVMFDHMMDKAGDWMVGYRYMYSPQDGETLNGSNPVGDQLIVDNACGVGGCHVTPVEHNMHMHMVEIMYAPTDWLTLMLMPQFVDMNMSFRPLDGAPEEEAEEGHHHGGESFEHATGGIGDTGMYALVKLFEIPGHHLHLSLGLSAPSGSVTEKVNGENLIHYAMQLGSGTWDFRPSLTYTGYQDRWSWGAQVSGVKRLQESNESGYLLGDVYQTTAWGSYSLFNWLSASVRGIYTGQGEIRGAYNAPHDDTAPVDFPGNYGGQFWDVGFGLNAAVTGGEFRGNRFSFEWLQPVHDDVKGYQLEREGGLSATWSLAF
jgi:hypothetical protein